jgi:hypothetical protein
MIDRHTSGALDQLLELTAIEPHAAALGREINLDTLTVGHHQIDLSPLKWCRSIDC